MFISADEGCRNIFVSFSEKIEGEFQNRIILNFSHSYICYTIFLIFILKLRLNWSILYSSSKPKHLVIFQIFHAYLRLHLVFFNISSNLQWC